MIRSIKQNQRGNVLWFILIAVVFVGLLTMVLTRSSSNVEQTGDREQNRIKSGQVLRYAKSIEAAVQDMRIKLISESDISFENDGTEIDYYNPNCEINDCRVFDVGGAGLVYRDPPPGLNDGSEWIFTGANNVGSEDNPVGTTSSRSGNDLIMLMPNANKDFCIELNRQLNIESSDDIPSDEGGIETTEFTGTYASALNIIDGDPSPFELDNQNAGCFIDQTADPDVIYFYYVLLAR